MTFLILNFGLTLLMLSGYLEWRCKREEGARPHIPYIFVTCGRLSPLIWGVLVIGTFNLLSWHAATTAALLSVMIPAFLSREIISHDKSPVIVPIGFIVGLAICAYYI